MKMDKCSCVDWALFVIRIGVAAVFIAHGIQKFGNLEMVVGFFGSLGLPAFVAYFVSAVEVVAGIALLLGVFTRIAAILIAIIMLVAIFLVKFKAGFLGGYELDFVLLTSAVGIALAGSGAIALMKDKCPCGKAGAGKEGACCGGGMCGSDSK